ncbi:TraR/DksA family transcriptional regulator [Sodalis endosymbiont of Spalangia cameroni]|uniref:TraR/DksA family transcriptional regulator n=1 Tax=Sodalis praecaptivus TaxID=1239307 RepID=UPI0031FA09F1
MPDAMDLIQWREEEERQHLIRRALSASEGVSRSLCADCDAPIPPARRQAIPGVQHCVTCQEINELKNKHYCRGMV